MAEAEAVHAGERYWAFLSYSHKDQSFGRRLHRRLEGYWLPRRLVGRATAQGTVPARLVPIFRDREELAAASDLSAEVCAALAQSRSLVVVCSPAAAASLWVSREVQLFRELHLDRPVLAALHQGEPEESFPPALRGSASEAVEPLAADFRENRDGDALGFLKLVAGIAGLPLDELVQRDAHRRARRVMAVTVAALIAMVVMGTLTAFALTARREAEHQRAQAEGLVEYMLTDLRDRLKGVGRLDVMAAVNGRALKYYSDQDLARLPADSLERRARILRAMGEDDETRGDYRSASGKFREAERTTAALLAEAPNDPDRIFDHAQSEFYIGLVEYERHNHAAAQRMFEAYKRLADRLAQVAPSDPRSAQEVGFADGNLCSNALELHDQAKLAVRYCTAALTNMEKSARRSGSPDAMRRNLANRHSWLASAFLAAGDNVRASEQIAVEDGILDDLLHRDAANAVNKHLWVSLQRQSAWMEAQMGRGPDASSRLAKAEAVLDQMILYEANNNTWRELRALIKKDESNVAAKFTKGRTQ